MTVDRSYIAGIGASAALLAAAAVAFLVLVTVVSFRGGPDSLAPSGSDSVQAPPSGAGPGAAAAAVFAGIPGSVASLAEAGVVLPGGPGGSFGGSPAPGGTTQPPSSPTATNTTL